MKVRIFSFLILTLSLMGLLVLASCQEEEESESEYDDMGLSYHCIDVCNLTVAKWDACVAEAEENGQEFEPSEDKLGCVDRCKSDLDAHIALECFHDQCDGAKCAQYLDCRAQCEEE